MNMRRIMPLLLLVAALSPSAKTQALSDTAVYAWYPGRYNGKDALRMGNYSMLGYVGGNIALEFFYSGPHSLMHRMHLNNGHGAPDKPSARSESKPVTSGNSTAVGVIQPLPVSNETTVRP